MKNDSPSKFDGEIIVLFSTLVVEKSNTTSSLFDLNHSPMDVMYPGYNNYYSIRVNYCS